MPSLSVGFAPGARHCVHVAQVAGPFGVMTTYAVTEPEGPGDIRCCALAACAARVTMKPSPRTTNFLFMHFPLFVVSAARLHPRNVTSSCLAALAAKVAPDAADLCTGLAARDL